MKIETVLGWNSVSMQIATVIKRTEKIRIVEVLRKMTRGTLEQINKLVQVSVGGTVVNEVAPTPGLYPSGEVALVRSL